MVCTRHWSGNQTRGRSWSALFALIGACVLTPASYAQTGLDGWGSAGGPGNPTYTSQSAFGVTLGQNSLRVGNNMGGFWGPSTGNLMTQGITSALQQATAIRFDLTMIGTELNGGAGFQGFAQSNELSWSLFANPGGSLPGGFNSFGQRHYGNAAGGGPNPVDTDSLNLSAQWSGVDGTRTITYDLTAYVVTDPTDGQLKSVGQFLQAHPDVGDSKFNFTAQAGGGSATTANFYWDNVRLLDAGGNTLALIGNFETIPEPTSLALAGLAVPGVIAAIRRRRRMLAA